MSENQPNSPSVSVVKKKKVYEYSDLIYLESPNKISTFGKNPVSDIKSSPCYGFGTSDREKEKKVYISKDLSKLSMFGNIYLLKQ